MPTPERPLTGEGFRQMFEAGARCVEAHVDEINALNVFPVPDGDTGINMLLTMQAALRSDELPPVGTGTVAEVSAAISRGALLGARGNSGVIFSQFTQGMAQGLSGVERCGGSELAAALRSAADAGYRAVGKPVEGTMLTVMRMAAEGIAAAGTLEDVLAKAYDAASAALLRTPDQLPVLKEAGVVDAGGQGVVAFLAGALGYLTGGDVPLSINAPTGGVPSVSVSQEFLEHSEDEMYGFCTQFIVSGEGLDVDSVRARVSAIAGSTVVIGDPRTVRIHAHATDPGPLLSLGVALGAVDQISIQNMDLQHQQFMALHGYTPEAQTDIAVVAVAPGEGLARVFRSLHVAQVVTGGQTMNPSAAQLLDAVRRANARHTIILPNNPNIVMAARQAASLAGDNVTVVPSRNVPQGVAAMLAFNPDHNAEEVVESMTAALDSVRSGEVTTAVRSTTLNGIDVVEGQAIALLDDMLVAAAASPNEALVAMLEGADVEEGSLITLYTGSGNPQAQTGFAVNAISARFPGVEVEVIDGGQAHYNYLVSIE